MFKILLSSIFIILSISASAQFYGWSKSIGGWGADTCAALTVDNQANLYILGSFSGTGEFSNDSISDKLTSSGNDDIFLQKRTKKGKYLFSKKIGGKGNDRPSNMIYYKGALYISGTLEDTVDFGIEKVAPVGLAKRSIFLAKMDTLGKCIWVKTIGDSAQSRARSLAINKDGIYLSGEISGKVDNVNQNNSMFIQKRDFSGSIIWTKTFGTKRNVVSNAIATDSLGNIYNVGALLGANIDFNPSANKDSLLSTSSANFSDIFMQKLTANGDFKWAIKMGGATNDEATAIAIKGNELFLSGNFSSTVDFDPSSTVVSNLTLIGGAKDIFVGKYDLNGKFSWIKQIGSASEESAKQLEIDKYKNIYLCGTFSTKNGTTTDFMGMPLKTSGNSDAFLLKFNSTGKGIFARTFSGSGADFSGAIKADTMQNIYVAGTFTGTINLDPTNTFTSTGTNDVFIFKSLLFSESDNYFEPKSSENKLLSFTLKSPDSTKIEINDVNITIQVPKGTDLTKLVAKFTNSDKSKVTVNGILQTSGVTSNNFLNKLVEYVVTAEDGTKKSYFVTINYCTSKYNKIYLSQEAYCPNQEINFSLSSQYNYLIKERYWNFGNGKYFTQKDINSSLKNSYSTTGVFNVAVSYLNPECFNSLDTTSVQLSISDKLQPNSDFYLGKSTLCPNEPFSLNASSNNEVSYVWDMGDKSTYTGSSVNHAYKEEWDNSVKLTVTNACGNSTTTSKIIKVSKKATTDNNANAKIYSSTTACIGEPVSFNANGSYQSILWNFKDNSMNVTTTYPSHSFKLAGDYLVQARLTDYCGVEKLISKNITIKSSMPFTNIQAITDQKVCPGEKARLNYYQYSSGIKNYSWLLPNNEIILEQSFEKTFNEGLNTIYLKLTNYCGNDTMLTTKINVTRNIPISTYNSFLNNQETEFCPNEEFSIRYNSSGIKSYVWTGQGLVNQEDGYAGYFKLSNYGEYTMQLKLTSFCGKDTTLMTKVKIVKNKPFKEQFSDYTFNRSYCPGEEIYFSKNNYSSNYKLEEYDYGDGKKGTSSSHTYAAFGDYNVKLKLTNFCNADTTIQATVKIAPVSISKDAYIYVSRNYNNNTEEVAYCKGDEIRLYVSSNQGGSYKSIVWDFGDGTELVDNFEPSHVFAKSGILTIKAKLTSYCGDTLTIFKKMNIRTDVGHKGYVDEDIPNAVCPGENANFSIYQNFKAVAWDFGDGTSSTKKSTTHSYTKTGMYTVTMKLTNNCNVDTLIKSTVEVRNDVTPDIDFNSIINEICPGEKIVFFQSADSRDYQISYDFGDNSKDYTIVDSIAKYNLVLVSHKFLTKGTYQLKVTAKNKCGLTDTDIETITVQDGMKLNAGSDIESEKITEDTAIFLLESHGAEFTWNFGKNDIVKTDVGYIQHGFSSAGNKNISVFVKSACGDTATFYTQMTINKLTKVVNATSCGNYLWNNKVYTQSGLYSSVFTNKQGVDSIVTLQLTIYAPSKSTTVYKAKGNYTWNAKNYTQSGVYTYSTKNVHGCDSVATLELTIESQGTSTISISTCGSYDWNGKKYSHSGSYTYTTKNAQGNDSIATLLLNILPSSSSSTNITANGAYAWNGSKYITSGVYTFTTKSAKGCDSIATLVLTIVAPGKSTTVVSACDNFMWNGKTYIQNGVFTFSTKTNSGADSTATLLLTISKSSNSTFNHTTCGTYLWNGMIYTKSGQYVVTAKNTKDCDSTITLNLTINENPSVLTGIQNGSLFATQTNGKYQWLHCDANNSAVKDAITQAFLPMQSGNYAVQVTKNGCVDTSACISFETQSTSGIKDVQEARFTIYPNPNQGIFQISGLPIGSYKIMNLMGAEVYRFRVENTDIQTLNLEQLAKGVYQVASEDIKIIHNKVVITD